MVQQTEVGVQDFVLLDEITLEHFMENLHTRWVDRPSSAASSRPIPHALRADAVVCVSLAYDVRVLEFS